jgi:hypothetical protein
MGEPAHHWHSMGRLRCVSTEPASRHLHPAEDRTRLALPRDSADLQLQHISDKIMEVQVNLMAKQKCLLQVIEAFLTFVRLSILLPAWLYIKRPFDKDIKFKSIAYPMWDDLFNICALLPYITHLKFYRDFTASIQYFCETESLENPHYVISQPKITSRIFEISCTLKVRLNLRMWFILGFPHSS